jgi:hypothetical protein
MVRPVAHCPSLTPRRMLLYDDSRFIHAIQLIFKEDAKWQAMH